MMPYLTFNDILCLETFNPRLIIKVQNKQLKQVMSSKKIVRLKTPVRSKQNAKSPQSTFATHFLPSEEETVMMTRNVEYNENVQISLINEINKLYKEIQTLKQNAREERETQQELQRQKKKLKGKMQMLQRQYKMYKQMYELQRDNHQRLRLFYQNREKEWVLIVNDHKRMLEEFDCHHGTDFSKIENQQIGTVISLSSCKNIGETVKPKLIAHCSERDVDQPRQSKERRKIKRSSLQHMANQKNKNKAINEKQVYYYREMSRLYEQEQQFTKNNDLCVQNISNNSKANGTYRDAQTDQLIDKIMRQTFYKLKEKQLTVDIVEQMDDMVKLKNAKTSTRERLAKTIRKLDFQVNSQAQMRILCEYVEKAVFEKYQILRGDYAFDFLIEKLKECQKMANSSNSQLQRLDKQKSEFKQKRQPSTADKVPDQKVYNDYYGSSIRTPSKLNKSQTQKLSQKNLELMLNSMIKHPTKVQSITKKVNESQLSQHIRYSISSIHNLSDLIHCETGLGPQKGYLGQYDEYTTANATLN